MIVTSKTSQLELEAHCVGKAWNGQGICCLLDVIHDMNDFYNDYSRIGANGFTIQLFSRLIHHMYICIGPGASLT